MSADDFDGKDRDRRTSFNPTAISEIRDFSVLPRLASLSRNSTCHRSTSTWHSLPAPEALLRSLSAPDDQRMRTTEIRLPRLSSTPPTKSSHSRRLPSRDYDIQSRHPVLPQIGVEREGTRDIDEEDGRQTRRHFPGYLSSDRAPHNLYGWDRFPQYNTFPAYDMNSDIPWMPQPLNYGVPLPPPWAYQYPNMFFASPWPAHYSVYNPPQQGNHMVVPHRPLRNNQPLRTYRRYGYVRRRNWDQISKREAATIIQKIYRGYRVREQIRYLKYVTKKRAAYELVDQLIDEYMSTEVIPDLLIEILKEYDAHGGLDPESPIVSISVAVCDDLIRTLLPKITRDVVVEANNEMVRDYMLSGWQQAVNPVTSVCNEMIEMYVTKTVHEVVHDVTSSLVEDQLLTSRAEFCLDLLISETCLHLLEGIASVSLYECHIESIADEITGDVLAPLLFEFVRVALQESSDAVRQQQVEAVSDFAVDKVLDDLMLQQLLGHVADCGDLFMCGVISHRLLDTVLAGFLLQQHWSVHHSLNQTCSNAAVEHLHRDLFGDVATSVLATLLVSHLDEDMEDIYQQQGHLSLDMDDL